MTDVVRSQAVARRVVEVEMWVGSWRCSAVESENGRKMVGMVDDSQYPDQCILYILK